MKQLRLICLPALFIALPCLAVEEVPTQPLCEEPAYTVRSLPQLPGITGKMNPLLSAEEAKDPEAGRSLAAQPGPYGHSELGFRYLARLFGYPGDFQGGQPAVERWVAEQEVNNYLENKGLKQVWEKWVVNAPKRLSVPVGPVRRIPADANPDIFFKNIYEKASLGRCISFDLAELQCENHLGYVNLKKGHVVYFGKPGGRAPCKAHWKGPVQEGPAQSEEVVELRKDSVQTRTTRWSRENDSTDSGSSGNRSKSKGAQ